MGSLRVQVNLTACPADVRERLGLAGRKLVPGPSSGRACWTVSNSLYIVVVGETRVSGSLSLTEVASELDPETLQRLKRECGGLQTLLRNNHQVFEGKGIGP